AIFKHTSGREEIRKTCAAAFLYSGWDTKYHGETTEYPFLATSLCDKLGLCTQEISNILYWFSACREQEALSKDKTGLDLSQLGSQEFFEKLIDMIVTRTGFGDLLALGIRRAGIELGGGADELARAQVTPSGYVNDAYSARLYLPNGIAYATEARNPIIQLHEYSFIMLKWSLWYTTAGSMSTLDTETLRKIAKRDWGSEAAADLSTYDGKARAGFIIQNRQHAKETMVACDRYFPILDSDQTGTGLGDPTFVPRLFSAVTGQDLSLDQYFQLGERSMNLQRAIMAREGRIGREQDALGEFNYTETIETEEGMVGLFNPDLEFPAAGDEIITLKGKSVDRDSFEKMKDDYYSLRGWDITTGLQTQKTLDKLKLSFVAEELDDLEALKK
ncbi:MAG: hypothetical protein GY868_10495, partial [Deltaproteobacteria bacterium]|nr:hypothetical protein [Deltaproteobacteria bacterium]